MYDTAKLRCDKETGKVRAVYLYNICTKKQVEWFTAKNVPKNIKDEKSVEPVHNKKNDM